MPRVWRPQGFFAMYVCVCVCVCVYTFLCPTAPHYKWPVVIFPGTHDWPQPLAQWPAVHVAWSHTASGGTNVLVFKKQLADLLSNVVLSAGLLDLHKVSFIFQQQFRIHQNVIFSPSTYLKMSKLNVFNLQFENEVEPKGQKNKSQTNLS